MRGRVLKRGISTSIDLSTTMQSYSLARVSTCWVAQGGSSSNL